MAVTVRQPPGSRRLLRAGAITHRENVIRAMDAVAENHVRNHPQYQVILDSLREGIAIAEIARYFANEQWITISEKTFAEYLYVFRKRCWNLVIGQDPDDIKQGINRFVSAHKPELDVDNELDRAIRFQQLRLGIGHANEQNLGMPLEQVGRDVLGLGKLLELKAKRKGLLSITKAVQTGLQGTTANARDELAKVRTDEEDQSKLYAMANELVGRTRSDANN